MELVYVLKQQTTRKCDIGSATFVFCGFLWQLEGAFVCMSYMYRLHAACEIHACRAISFLLKRTIASTVIFRH